MPVSAWPDWTHPAVEEGPAPLTKLTRIEFPRCPNRVADAASAREDIAAAASYPARRLLPEAVYFPETI